MEIVTRSPEKSEKPVLYDIWKTAFGDSDGDIDEFFDYFFRPEMSVVAMCAETPASAGYLVPAGNLICGGNSIRCAMIYAVATLPEYRGRGLGAALTRALISKGHTSGFPAVIMCPANDGLFGYYSRYTEMRDWFFMRQEVISCDMASSGSKDARLYPVSAKEYIKLRKYLLHEIPHIETTEEILSYQKCLCSEYGGGLFAVMHRNGLQSCTVVERRGGGQVWLKELLTPVDAEREALAAVASAFPAREYLIRTPASSGTVCKTRFGMLCAAAFTVNTGTSNYPWFGMAFE